MNVKTSGIAVSGIFALLLCLPLFGHLTHLPIRQYDESRLAINAYEMLHHHHVWVTHFGGQPDMWNTKPPLLIWIQVALMKWIGVNELAIRLPSALAGLCTCLILFSFTSRYFNSTRLGVMAGLVLVTSAGYVDLHATRTGDYDALLTLFTTLTGLYFFRYTQEWSIRDIYACAAWMTLATLTKGVAALLFLPAMFMFGLYSRSLRHLLTHRHFYLAMLVWLVVTVGYYLLRESLNPGYIQAVYVNELGGRYLDVIEHHRHGFGYYAKDLLTKGFFPWVIFLPLGAWFALRYKAGDRNPLVMFSVIMALGYFLIISAAGTKLEWYEVPMYPWLALVTGKILYDVRCWFERKTSSSPDRSAMSFVFLVLLFAFPYGRICSRTLAPEEPAWVDSMYDISYFLRDALKGRYDLDGARLVHPGYHPQVEFYVRLLQAKDTEVQYQDYRALQPGDTVIVSQPDMVDSIQVHFDSKLLYQVNTVQIRTILQPHAL